jgi:hypothetical protein
MNTQNFMFSVDEIKILDSWIGTKIKELIVKSEIQKS